MDAKIIKQEASGRWLDIFKYLAPTLEMAIEKVGKHVPDPVYGGKNGFRLFRDAPQTGASYSNKDGALSDGFATLMYATGQDFKTVLNEVADFLGINESVAKSNSTRKTLAPAKSQNPVWLPSPEEIIKRKNKLRSYWKQTSRLTEHASGRALTYLLSRGIRNLEFIKQNQDLRFHPATWYKDSFGQLKTTPAFIQVWRTPDGTAVNIHKILLDPNGSAKAQVEKPKLQMKPSGSMTGGAIRLGEPAFGTLSVATGVETALSVTEMRKIPCWSTLNDGLLRGFIPPEEVVHLIIWADNDRPDKKDRNSGIESARALKARLAKERPEMKVEIKIPPEQGKDWNDYLMSGDKAAFYE